MISVSFGCVVLQSLLLPMVVRAGQGLGKNGLAASSYLEQDQWLHAEPQGEKGISPGTGWSARGTIGMF